MLPVIRVARTVACTRRLRAGAMLRGVPAVVVRAGVQSESLAHRAQQEGERPQEGSGATVKRSLQARGSAGEDPVHIGKLEVFAGGLKAFPKFPTTLSEISRQALPGAPRPLPPPPPRRFTAKDAKNAKNTKMTSTLSMRSR